MTEKLRISKQSRETFETKINLELILDGKGTSEVETGIGFFDHMLTLFAKHSLMDLKVNCKGDLEVDGHHTVEDVGIVLGIALSDALADKKGIRRYGSVMLPMDETLIICAVDLSGRPYLACDLSLDRDKVGDFDTELTKEFLQAFAYSARINLHVKQISGDNCHHIIEAVFKALGQATRQAVEYDARIEGTLSTKGSLS
ncbi:imidazoleglycerol-phosphate dehydratase [Desulfitispora alkaliphila]